MRRMKIISIIMIVIGLIAVICAFYFGWSIRGTRLLLMSAAKGRIYLKYAWILGFGFVAAALGTMGVLLVSKKEKKNRIAKGLQNQSSSDSEENESVQTADEAKQL